MRKQIHTLILTTFVSASICIAGNQSTTISITDYSEVGGLTLTGNYLGTATWFDYDNDDDLDFIVSGSNGASSSTKLYKNTGSDTFVEQSGTSFIGVYLGAVAVADYNNDGFIDVFICGKTGSTTYASKLYKNNGDSTFTETTSAVFQNIGNSNAKWADYDKDGDQDLLISGYTGSVRVTKLYRNNGDETFTEVITSLPGMSAVGLDWADYNLDGYLDVVMSGVVDAGYKTAVYEYNENTQDFFELSDGSTFTGLGNGSAQWGDYDKNGYPDLVITGDNGTKYTEVYKNNLGNPTKSLSASGPTTAFTKLAQIDSVSNGAASWGDYDNDGDLDIVVTGNCGAANAKVTRLYTNNASSFSASNIALTGGFAGNAAFGDYDGDFDADLVICGGTGAAYMTKVYKNITNNPYNAPPTTPAITYSEVLNGVLSFAWGSATDAQTTLTGLTYNAVVEKYDAGTWVPYNAAHANTETGKLKIASFGVHRNNSRLYSIAITPGSYRCMVQAIDNSFIGGSFSVPVYIPASEQAHDITVVKSQTSASISWTRGSGDSCIVFVAEKSTGTAIPLTDSSYTANPAFGSGSGLTGKWACVYKGQGSSVNISNLTPNTAYRVMVLEYINDAGVEMYDTVSATNNPKNFSTSYVNVEEHKSGISVYPNPATDALHIAGIQQNDIITITDMNGKVLITVKADTNGMNIDISTLASGMYLVNAQGQKIQIAKQ